MRSRFKSEVMVEPWEPARGHGEKHWRQFSAGSTEGKVHTVSVKSTLEHMAAPARPSVLLPCCPDSCPSATLPLKTCPVFYGFHCSNEGLHVSELTPDETELLAISWYYYVNHVKYYKLVLSKLFQYRNVGKRL